MELGDLATFSTARTRFFDHLDQGGLDVVRCNAYFQFNELRIVSGR